MNASRRSGWPPGPAASFFSRNSEEWLPVRIRGRRATFTSSAKLPEDFLDGCHDSAGSVDLDVVKAVRHRSL